MLADKTLKYENFLSALGTKIHTSTHLKFMDYTNPDDIEGEFLYHETELQEVLFKVPTLKMERKNGQPLDPNPALKSLGLSPGDDLVNGKKKDLSVGVIILYNDCEQQYQPDTLIWSTAYGIASSQIIIIIDPLKNGLFRCRIHTDPSSKALSTNKAQMIIGPVLDGMVLNEELLPGLIRQTVINVSNAIIEWERQSGSGRTIDLSGEEHDKHIV